jgi:hypothetical protein
MRLPARAALISEAQFGIGASAEQGMDMER